MIRTLAVPSPVRRAGHTIAVVVLIAVVVPFAIYAVPGVAGADQSFVVLSGSMEPTFAAGDAILIERVDPTAVQEGDVIAFRNGESAVPTVHRVAGVVETEFGTAFQTMGDANESPDQRLTRPSQVVGRVPTVGGHLFVLPWIGHVILFAGTTIGFVLLLVVPLGLLIGWELRSLLRAARSRPGDGDGAVLEDGSDRASAANDEGTLSISRESLTLVVPVLGAFAAYAGWTALLLRSGLAIAVAVGATVSFVLTVALVLTARWSSAGEPAPLPAVTLEPIRIEVGSLQAVLMMAESRGLGLRWDPDRRELATLEGSVSFVARIVPSSTLGSSVDIALDANADDRTPAEADGGSECLPVDRNGSLATADPGDRP